MSPPIDLSGATWGLTCPPGATVWLRVLAIGSAWGVTLQGVPEHLVRTTRTVTVGAQVTEPRDVLVTVNPGGSTPSAVEVGHFAADCGAQPGEWTVGATEVGGTADGLKQPWVPIYAGFSTNPTHVTSGTFWTQVGSLVHVQLAKAIAASPTPPPSRS